MFPYIREIKVNDCYAYQNFTIRSDDSEKFRHIILTGKNGSGKSTILNRINSLFIAAHQQGDVHAKIKRLKQLMHTKPKNPSFKTWAKEHKELTDIELSFSSDNVGVGFGQSPPYVYFENYVGSYVYSFFVAHRSSDLEDVETVKKEIDPLDQLRVSINSELFVKQFKQYLVNKKVYEAFDYMNSKEENLVQSKEFFSQLSDVLKVVFKDDQLRLEFVQDIFEFHLKLGDKREVTFNQLSEGFSAYISILMDLLMRTDLIRRHNNSFGIDPPGVVLIDEPETHLHIEMQYEILPLLSKLFPNIQFIIATHSPAIISSLENATIYDISTHSNVEGWVLGSSYSELMIKHFGLENEFGPSADKVIAEIDEAFAHKDLAKIQEILKENESILTRSLRLDIESKIIAIERSIS